MGPVAAMLSRLPTRVRVTLAFSAVMAVLLAGAGLFLSWQLGRTLNATIDQGLRSRAGDVGALVEQSDSGLSEGRASPLAARGEGFAQILDPAGMVVDATPRMRARSLLSPAELGRATRHTVFLRHGGAPGRNDPVRLLATPVRAQDRRLVIVVGSSLGPVEDALSRLRGLLLVGVPIALLLASLAGYGAAAGALRPVELMRRRAQEIQAALPGRRLPVAASRDEVGRLGETLNEMLDRLEAAFVRERRFVSDASHELRTPLAILRAELELALRDATDVEGFRAAVASAVEETDRLVQLAEDLLVIARADQGRLPVRLADVRPAGLLEAVVQRFGGRAAEHGVSLTVEPGGEELVLSADELRVEQALGNLVDNALRHGASAVELSLQVSDGAVALHVRDDGSGFAESFLPVAFERFTRGEAGRTGEGAGLGLSIVDAIARAHSGRARARNRPGGGADVWIELPLADKPAAAV